MSASRLSTARDVLRQLGPTRFSLEIPWWLLRRSYVFYTIDPRNVPQPEARDTAFPLTLITEEDLPDVISVRPGMYTLPQLRARLKAGHLGFAVRAGSEIVSSRWVFVREVHLPYLARRVVLGAGEGFMDELYTAPQWRQKGAVTASGQQIYRLLQARGFRRINCAIAAWNLLPRRLAEAFGYTRVGSGGFWSIAGYRKYFWEGGVEERNGQDLILHGPDVSP